MQASGKTEASLIHASGLSRASIGLLILRSGMDDKRHHTMHLEFFTFFDENRVIVGIFWHQHDVTILTEQTFDGEFSVERHDHDVFMLGQLGGIHHQHVIFFDACIHH